MIKLDLMDFCQCDCDSFEPWVEHAIEEVENEEVPLFISKRVVHHNTIISCKRIAQCQKMISYLKMVTRDQNNPLNESRNKEV